MSKTLADLVAGFKLYPVWLHQAYYFLSAKYKRTALGSFWIAGNFLFVSLAIAFVFGTIFQRDLKEMLAYVMLGNLCATTCLWTVSDAPELFCKSSAIIRNHAYPFSYFSYEDVARVFMLFGHNLVVFYIVMSINGTLTMPHWTILPGIIVNIFVMLTWGTVVGILSARYRDLRFLLPNLSFMLFFLTPIYWHISMLGEDRRWIADYNPLYSLVSLLREPLLGHAPTQANWLAVAIISVTGLIAWFLAFSNFRRRIPFWV